MSSEKEIGEVLIKTSHEFEWAIGNFFSYAVEGASYNSPRFHLSGSRWYLKIYPNGEDGDNNLIGLYLMREKDSATPGANYTFGLKRADGRVEQRGTDNTWVFEDGGFGQSELLTRSELLRRKSELAADDVLTITCTLWVNKNLNSFARMDRLSQNLTDSFISERGCDATLKVNQETFSVHKCILTARSTVFAAMFEVEMKEKNTGVVDIVDCDPESFKDFLGYLYSGKADNLSRNAFELCRIADKYEVKELRSACILSIMGNLTLENVLDAAVLGNQLSEIALKIKTQKVFNKHFSEIVFTAKWESLMKSNYLLANELLKNLGSHMTLKE